VTLCFYAAVALWTQVAAAPTPIRLQDRAEIELTGDTAPETILVTATGPDWRSLDVRLEIRSASGETLFQDRWPSSQYFNRAPRVDPRSPDAIEKVVRGDIATIVGDQKARQADMIARGHGIHSESEMRDAIAWDLRNAGQDPSRARVDALVRELRTQPKFIFFSGNESHTGIAWSAMERRFVRVYLCC
jgi:hypothetical protein